MSRYVLTILVLAAVFALLVTGTAEARKGPKSKGPQSKGSQHKGNPHYYPLPAKYDRGHVQVFSGIKPGATTLGDVLGKYGKPVKVVNNRYFYYSLPAKYEDRPYIEDVYITFKSNRGLGPPRYDNRGVNLAAIVDRIYVYPRGAFGYGTYLDQVKSVTVYPNRTLYNPDLDFYTLVFPAQGYAMYYDGDQLLTGEVYYAPDRFGDSKAITIKLGDFTFNYVDRDELPIFLW